MKAWWTIALLVAGCGGAAPAAPSPSCALDPAGADRLLPTVEGPRRLAAALVDPTHDIAAREHVARRLFDLDRRDVHGPALLAAALPDLEPALRSAIVAEATVSARAGLTGGPRRAARLADALVTLAPWLDPAARAELAPAVLASLLDREGTPRAARASVARALEALDGHGTEVLVAGLRAGPTGPDPELSRAVAEHGDADARAALVTRLLSVEREMNEPAYRDGLRARRLEGLASEGAVATDARLERLVDEDLRRAFAEGLFPSLHAVAREAAIGDRLLDVAEDVSFAADRRSGALAALRGGARPAHARGLLSLALDADEPPAVRRAAFARLSETGSEDAVDRLLAHLRGDPSEVTRRPAATCALAIGGAEALPRLLRALPSGPGARYAAPELEGYVTAIAAIRPAPRDALVEALGTTAWPAQVVAMRAIARVGSREDLEVLAARAEDATPTDLDGGPALGAIARDAHERLRARLAGQGTAPQGVSSMAPSVNETTSTPSTHTR